MDGEDKAALEAQLAQTQQSLQKAASFGMQLAEDNKVLRAQMQQLQEQLEASEAAVQVNLGGSDVNQQRRLDALTKEYEEVQQKAVGLEGTCKELILRLESKESEVSSLETRVVDFSRRNEEVETQNRSLIGKLKQSSAMADQAMSLNEEMETLRAKVAEFQSKEQSQHRLVASLEERLAEYQSQYEDSHSKSASEHETLVKQVEKLNAELGQKNTKIARLEALQSTSDELQSQSSELLETITALKEENQLLQRQLEMKDTVIAQQKARALSLLATQSQAPTTPSDAVISTPSRKANLGALLQTTPTHSRNPSTGSSSSAALALNGTNNATQTLHSNTSTPPPLSAQQVADAAAAAEAQLLLKQQQDQLNTMQAQLEAREKDMEAQQRQLMEALTKINLNIVATRPKPPGTCVVLLGNLPEEVIYDPDIIASMEDLVGGSEIKSFRWVSKDGEFLGFGFLEFLTTKDADKAVSRNGKVYLNRQISIAFATREEFEAGKPRPG